MLRRHGDDVSIQVLRNEGQIRIAAVYYCAFAARNECPISFPGPTTSI